MPTLPNVDILDAILQSVVATRLWDVEENWFFGLIIKIGGVCAAQMNEWDSHSSKLKPREKLEKKLLSLGLSKNLISQKQKPNKP